MGKLGRRLVGQAMAMGQKGKINHRSIPTDTKNGSSFRKTTDFAHRSHGFVHCSNDLAYRSHDLAHCSNDLAHLSHDLERHSKELNPCFRSMGLA
jgi:hypothetical protein